LAYLVKHCAMSSSAVAETCVHIAAAKAALPLSEDLSKGALCNLLVCLACGMLTLAGRCVMDEIIAGTRPISAFVLQVSITASRTCTVFRRHIAQG
jgi:formate transporter